MIGMMSYRELNKKLAQQALQEVRRTWAWKGIWLALGGAAAYQAAVEAWGPGAPVLALAVVGVIISAIGLGLFFWSGYTYIIAEAVSALIWTRALRRDRER
jgi:hypothetical protein